MSAEEPAYRFAPHQPGATLFGLRAAQAAGLAVGLAAALACLAAGAPLAAATVLAVGGVWAFLPVAGRPPYGWAGPLWAQRRSRTHSPQVAVHPFGPRRCRPTVRQVTVPAAGPVRITDTDTPAGPAGVAVAGRGGGWSVTLAVTGACFVLSDSDAQHAAVAGWGQVLAGLAAARNGPRRLQVTDLTRAGTAAPTVTPASPDQPPDAARAAYRAHEAAVLGANPSHSVYVTASGGAGRGHHLEAAATACARLAGLLADAGFAARPVPAAELADVLTAMIDPARPAPTAAWQARWDHLQAGGSGHAVFEAAELPRLPVGPGWAWPLVLGDPAGLSRTLALHVELAPPAAALRRAERAVLAHDGDAEWRARWGFRSGARRAAAADAARGREAELAAGYSDARFVLLAGVAAADPDGLAAASAALEADASRAGIELRRLHGQQLDGLGALLPVGRCRLVGGWG